MRFSVFLFVTILAALPAIAECQLRSVWRGANVASYLPHAHACLENPGADIWFDSAVEEEMLGRINEERTNAGLPPLELRTELIAPARLHSFDMAQEDFFDHEGPDGRVAGHRISALDRTLIFSEVRENIARLGGDLDYTSTGWLLHRSLITSEGHRENILSPNVTHVAIGVSRRAKGAWVTQIFVRVEGALDLSLIHI